MPFPFKPRKGPYTAPSHVVLKDRPERALQIAMIASASTEIEVELTRLVGVASWDRMRAYGAATYGSLTYGGVSNMIVSAALDALESMSGRLSVTRAILKQCVSEELCAQFEQLAVGLRRAAGMRNDVVHQVWTIHPSYPMDLLVQSEMTGHYTRYTERCFDAVLERLKAEAWNIRQFRGKCAAYRAEQQQKAAQQPKA